MITATKLFADIPFAHRQHTHAGHCRFIHGHNWAFEVTFFADQLDACGFVIDFGGAEMKQVKQWINDTFDHKLLLNEVDPARKYLVDGLTVAGESRYLTDVELFPFADIAVVPDCSCEGLAKWIFRKINDIVYDGTKGRVKVRSVKVIEDSKNYATFQP